jgi:hypothetical protein
MKRLPLGIQTFEEIRSNGCVYVDKTEAVYNIASNVKVCFLSRPRRFGKSLLISTFNALFSGRKELFEGLYIYDKWDWSQQYPVIRIDWTLIDHSTPEEMKMSMAIHLKRIAQAHQLTLKSQSASDCFAELIMLLHDKTGKPVVILIDEYDKPITKHLFSPHLKAIKDAVHDFYQVMKGDDENIRFIFLTGVSKFSGLSVFSALNNLTDVSLHQRYASICGYTQEELESNFSEYIDAAAGHLGMTREDLLGEIRYWYNGYSWDGQTAVYNPFSTMNFFDMQEFIDYWYATGTPTFLIEMIQRCDNPNIVLEDIAVDNSLFKGYDPANINETIMLFQTGYLTVKQKELNRGIPSYTLGVPNMEVSKAFLTYMLKLYGQYSNEQFIDKLRKTMEAQIIACDEAGFARSLEVMTATVPYGINKINEAYYHTMMLIWMRLLGFKIHGETPNDRGRADAVWEQPGVTVVAEIKYHAKKKTGALLKEAMKQIHDRRYYNRYLGKVILLGVAFAGRNVGCRMEVIHEKWHLRKRNPKHIISLYIL